MSELTSNDADLRGDDDWENSNEVQEELVHEFDFKKWRQVIQIYLLIIFNKLLSRVNIISHLVTN